MNLEIPVCGVDSLKMYEDVKIKEYIKSIYLIFDQCKNT